MADPSLESPELALERQAARHREVEHRVKNTLQLISSIVLLQARVASDAHARDALKAVQQRVAAVSVAHRHVTWVDEGEQVEAAALIREIVGGLAGSARRAGLTIDLDLESFTIPGQQAAPVALIVSEIVGNALRHAFPEEREGHVRVGLRRAGERYEVVVEDDGVGVPGGVAPAGFGLTVVQLMAQQLRARLETEAAQPGLKLFVSVPMDANQPRT